MNLLAIFTGPYALLAKWGVIALLGLAIFLTGWVKGNQHGTNKLTDYQVKQATEAVRIARGRDVVTTQVVTKYIKVKGETEVVTKTVEKEVIKYAEANPGYCFDPAWRVLHDAAAANTVPNAGPPTDAAPRAAEAIATVTENYAACHRNEDRLTSLQDWVRKQQAVH